MAVARTISLRRGKIVSRNAIVSGSMTMTSTKFAVIHRTLYLNCDSATKPANIASDNAAEMSGRRNNASQKKFTIPQARM